MQGDAVLRWRAWMLGRRGWPGDGERADEVETESRRAFRGLGFKLALDELRNGAAAGPLSPPQHEEAVERAVRLFSALGAPKICPALGRDPFDELARSRVELRNVENQARAGR